MIEQRVFVVEMYIKIKILTNAGKDSVLKFPEFAVLTKLYQKFLKTDGPQGQCVLKNYIVRK
jgi:hypothetical protein